MNKTVPALALIVFAAFFASACEKKGPAEEAGEKIDEAYSDAMDKAEEAGEKMEEAGEKVEEALEEAEEAVKDD
jgi:outer membrane lipoprotein-sorting protein